MTFNVKHHCVIHDYHYQQLSLLNRCCVNLLRWYESFVQVLTQMRLQLHQHYTQMLYVAILNFRCYNWREKRKKNIVIDLSNAFVLFLNKTHYYCNLIGKNISNSSCVGKKIQKVTISLFIH